MSGIGGKNIIDPVVLLQQAQEKAAAAAQAPELPTEGALSLEVVPSIPTPVGLQTAPTGPVPVSFRTCPAGHAVADHASFCPSCGAAMQARKTIADGAVKPAAELTDEERAAREAAHIRAVQAGRQDAPPAPIVQASPQAQTVLIHMVKDGLTAFGLVWMRGQELEIEVDGPRWADAQRWILQDDRQQMAHYGDVMFRPGPWPGLRTYTAGQYQELGPMQQEGARVTGPTREELARADEAERRRGRGVPSAAFR